MSEAIALVDPEKVTSKRALVLRDALKEDEEQRALLTLYIGKHMKENVDFGKIPGTDKPTLLKPGAEKLVDLFRCTPKFKLVKCEEDFDRGFFNYMFRVQLVSRDAKAVLAEGYGSANSKEGRYRWRNANVKCPTCSKETVIAGKPEYGGGWLCFAKKGGCGAKFKAGDKAIEGQARGQVENDDIATLANTILKMAKKRALVDGAIALARCSDMFTQDVEDMAEAAADYLERTAPIPPVANVDVPQPKTKALAEKVAARMAPKLPIIDVPAEPKAEVLPEDQFGSGRPLSEITAQQLANQKAHLMKLSGKAAQKKLDDVLAEEERREKLAASPRTEDEPAEPDEDVPF